VIYILDNGAMYSDNRLHFVRWCGEADSLNLIYRTLHGEESGLVASAEDIEWVNKDFTTTADELAEDRIWTWLDDEDLDEAIAEACRGHNFSEETINDARVFLKSQRKDWG